MAISRATRLILKSLSLVLLAVGIALQFLVILSGAVSNSIIDLIYFLQADTANIPGAQSTTRWTFFAICGENDDRNLKCGTPVAALPFDPPINFATGTNVPSQFFGTSVFHYLSQVMFGLFLISLLLAVMGLFGGAYEISRKGQMNGSKIGQSLAFTFQLVAVLLMLAWTVQGRNAFRTNHQASEVGSYGFGFTFGALFCFGLSTALILIGCSKPIKRDPKALLGRHVREAPVAQQC